MPTETLLHKLQTAPAGTTHVLDAAKAARMHASTMYVPSPLDIAHAIQAIPYGETRDLADIRRALALHHQVDITCPSRTTLYWKWLAAYSDSIHDAPSPYTIPWWRVLKHGKPHPTLPGGIANHLRRIQAEVNHADA
jgi:hypothetical protein